MLSLTRQERWIVVFAAALILIGSGLTYFGKISADRTAVAGYPIDEKGYEAKERVNINTAGIRKLITLKGIGPKAAERIIEYRDLNGSFFYIEDIQNVKGIGPKKFSAIKEWITVD